MKKKSLLHKARFKIRQSGFMSMSGHVIGAVLFPLAFFLTGRFLADRIESPLIFWLVMALMVFPLFLVTHLLADVIASSFTGKGHERRRLP